MRWARANALWQRPRILLVGSASAMPRKSRQRLPRCGHCCINRRTRRQHISFQISNFDACLPVFSRQEYLFHCAGPSKTSIHRRKAAVSFTMPPLLLFCFEFLRYTKNPNPSPIRNRFGLYWLYKATVFSIITLIACTPLNIASYYIIGYSLRGMLHTFEQENPAVGRIFLHYLRNYSAINPFACSTVTSASFAGPVSVPSLSTLYSPMA